MSEDDSGRVIYLAEELDAVPVRRETDLDPADAREQAYDAQRLRIPR